MPDTSPFQVRVPLTAPQSTTETSAIVWPAADPQAPAIILAHGAGTDMTHRLMRQHAGALSDAGLAVALFNFAYTEVGRKRPDPASRLESAWRDVITGLRPHLGPERRLVVGGRSMGGRIASMVAARDAAGLGIDGVVCIAYPLHPPGRPERLRVEHWPDLKVPVLIVNGSRDSMAPVDTLRDNLQAHMPPDTATLHILDGADHSFRVRKSDGRTEEDVMAETTTAITGWLAAL